VQAQCGSPHRWPQMPRLCQASVWCAGCLTPASRLQRFRQAYSSSRLGLQLQYLPSAHGTHACCTEGPLLLIVTAARLVVAPIRPPQAPVAALASCDRWKYRWFHHTHTQPVVPGTLRSCATPAAPSNLPFQIDTPYLRARGALSAAPHLELAVLAHGPHQAVFG
jgi:hypothetical protein